MLPRILVEMLKTAGKGDALGLRSDRCEPVGALVAKQTRQGTVVRHFPFVVAQHPKWNPFCRSYRCGTNNGEPIAVRSHQ